MVRFVPVLVVLACGMVLGSQSRLGAADPKPTAAEAELIAAVEKLGGQAAVDSALDKEARVAATFDKIDDTALAALAKQPGLGSLDIRSDAKATAKGYASLKELPNLQRLYLTSAALTIDESTAIASVRSLNTLVVVGCKLTDLDVVRFAKLKNLKVLDLMDTPVTDAGVEKLLALTKLEELNLSGTKVTDPAAKKLLALEALKLLQLNNTKVSADAIGKMEDQLRADNRGLKILR
jgi:hypothetical protein